MFTLPEITMSFLRSDRYEIVVEIADVACSQSRCIPSLPASPDRSDKRNPGSLKRAKISPGVPLRTRCAAHRTLQLDVRQRLPNGSGWLSQSAESQPHNRAEFGGTVMLEQYRPEPVDHPAFHFRCGRRGARTTTFNELTSLFCRTASGNRSRRTNIVATAYAW
jgi:hypothetical protein